MLERKLERFHDVELKTSFHPFLGDSRLTFYLTSLEQNRDFRLP